MARTSASLVRSRRRFLKTASAASLSAMLGGPVLALAQSAGSGKAPASKPGATPAPGTPAAGATPEKPSEFAEDARLMAQVIQRRYGMYLSAEQLKDITDELDKRMQSGKALRAVKLTNGDDPLAAFRA